MGGKVETVAEFIFLGSKITVDSDYRHQIKRQLLLGRKAMTNLDSVLKRGDITLRTNVHIVKAMVFPIVVYRCEIWTIKKTESRKIDAFELWCWKRFLRVPWTTRSNQSILKEITPEYSLEGLMLKLQYFGHRWEQPTHWKRPWCWERVRAGGEEANRGWNGWMASQIQWIWVWANPERHGRTGKLGMLQFMGLQTVRDHLMTEQQQHTIYTIFSLYILYCVCVYNEVHHFNHSYV